MWVGVLVHTHHLLEGRLIYPYCLCNSSVSCRDRNSLSPNKPRIPHPQFPARRSQPCNLKQVMPPMINEPTEELKSPNSPFQKGNNLVIPIAGMRENTEISAPLCCKKEKSKIFFGKNKAGWSDKRCNIISKHKELPRNHVC